MNIPSIESLLSELDKVRRERDEADCRAGAAERGYKSYLDAAVARDSWLRKAKSQWGVDNIVSFDVVWAEALAQKEQIEKLTAERDAALDNLHNIVCHCLDGRLDISAMDNVTEMRDQITTLKSKLEQSVLALREARSVLFAWAANHESQVTQEAIATINNVLGEE